MWQVPGITSGIPVFFLPQPCPMGNEHPRSLGRSAVRAERDTKVKYDSYNVPKEYNKVTGAVENMEFVVTLKRTWSFLFFHIQFTHCWQDIIENQLYHKHCQIMKCFILPANPVILPSTSQTCSSSWPASKQWCCNGRDWNCMTHGWVRWR